MTVKQAGWLGELLGWLPIGFAATIAAPLGAAWLTSALFRTLRERAGEDPTAMAKLDLIEEYEAQLLYNDMMRQLKRSKGVAPPSPYRVMG